ncbi:MAG: hypothetical protein HY361_02725 [Candidatus Aenigmarchaeota archaeon]|nr:hypothetical protein [Candidatus Aenigmarchaeota archaeon]
MRLLQFSLLTFFLLPNIALAQLDSNIVSALQITLIAIAAGASTITTVMAIEILKMLSTNVKASASVLEKCPECGKNSFAKAYDGTLLTSYKCNKCKHEEIKEKPIPGKQKSKSK